MSEASLPYYADANWTNIDAGVAVGVLRRGDEAWHCPHEHDTYGEAFDCAVKWAKRENGATESTPSEDSRAD